MSLSRFALMLVVFIDVMGFGLVLPIFNTILLDPQQSFLPKNTSETARQLHYGFALAVFFLLYFFGAAFIAKLSDYIGRRLGILICLVGALIGYVLTVGALLLENYWLLVLGRAISGFTTADQPIAQAALIDISKDEHEKSKNLGMIVGACGLGLLSGPLISGFLSDANMIGSFASLELPFYVAIGLISFNIVLILAFFHEPNFQKRKIDFGVSEVILNLWKVRTHPIVLRLALVILFALMGLNAFFFFTDTYLLAKFQFTTFQNSMALVVFGVTTALGGAYLTAPLHKRFRKIPILYVSISLIAIGIVAFVLNPIPWLSYALIVPSTLGFAVMYPTMLSLFSSSVPPSEQGWAMGIVVAMYALGSGVITALGGSIMTLNIDMPFIVGIGCCIIALAFMALWFQDPKIKSLGEKAES